MKYKVILVDDEQHVINTVKFLGEWDKYNFEIVGEMNSSSEAYNYLSTHNVDLVISDVDMPSMNGLKFLDKANENGYYKFSIIISGYDKFEYAKEAMKIGVLDYILKPVNPKELNSSLEKIAELLSKQESDLVDTELIVSEDPSGKFNVNRAKEYIDVNFSKPISLESVAYEFNVSKEYLSKVFKQNLGINFSKYLSERRMEEAMKLLKLGHSIKFVALSVGYRDTGYFHKVFKHYFGKTPIQFIEK